MTTAVSRGLAPVRAVLDNGAIVTAKRSTTTPAVTIHAGFLAGSVYDPPAHAGLAHFVSRTIDRGTATRPAGVIAEELDRRGVSLSTMVNRHATSLICTCLIDDLDDVLANAGDLAVFMLHVGDAHGGDRRTFQRGEQHPAQRIAQGAAIAALERADGVLSIIACLRFPFDQRGDHIA